jgi:hypothetical protein
MIKEEATGNDSDAELIDRIGKELPDKVKALYFREMLYLKDLPKNDEMLRILRILQILTLLSVEVPGKLAFERGKLETFFLYTSSKIQEQQNSNQTYLDKLNKHLAGIPKKIVEDISPAAIVAMINESLKQEFIYSTIPETGKALRLVSQEMRSALSEFNQTAHNLTSSYNGVTVDANKAIEKISGAISNATTAARNATKELSNAFQQHFRWALYALSSLALLIGICIGMFFDHWIEDPPIRKLYIYQKDSPAPPSAPDPVQVPVPKKHK